MGDLTNIFYGERRIKPRIQVSGNLEFSLHTDKVARTRIKYFPFDISESGLGIWSPSGLKKGQVLFMRRKGKSRSVPVEVRWSIMNYKNSSLNRYGLLIAADNAYNLMTNINEDPVVLHRTSADQTNENNLAVLGAMTRDIAHDVSNNITILLFRAEQLNELIDSKNFDITRLKDITRSFTKATKTIHKIVDSIRSFLRVQHDNDFELTSIGALFSDIDDLSVMKLKQHQIALKVEDSPIGLEIRCRYSDILRALLNLVSNSIDAIKNQPGEKWIDVRAVEKNDTVEFWVTDSGDGIPEAIRSLIFTPYYTTKAANGGSGLGLSIVAGIVSLHGGKVYLDETCKNTRFVISVAKHQ